MSDTTYDPKAHFLVPKRHLLRWIMVGIAVLVLAFLAFGGRFYPSNGSWNYVAPTIPPIHLTSSGSAPADATNYATTPNGEPVEVQTKIIYPLRDAKALAQQALDKATAAQTSLDASLQSMKDQMTKDFDEVKKKLDAPAPAQQQAVTVAPATAPQAPAMAQAAPAPSVTMVPAPQAPASVPMQVATGRIVTLDTASQRELSEMYATAKTLGRVPDGRKIAGFQELKKGEGFICPNGNPSPRVLGDDHHGHVRYDCKLYQ